VAIRCQSSSWSSSSCDKNAAAQKKEKKDRKEIETERQTDRQKRKACARCCCCARGSGLWWGRGNVWEEEPLNRIQWKLKNIANYIVLLLLHCSTTNLCNLLQPSPTPLGPVKARSFLFFCYTTKFGGSGCRNKDPTAIVWTWWEENFSRVFLK